MLQKFCKVWQPERAKVLHALTTNDVEILQGLTSSAVEILHALTSSAAEILHALTSSAAEILHTLTSSAAEILQAMTSWLKEILGVARFNAAEILNRCFTILKKWKTNCRGPKHTNSFDQFSFYAFSIFQRSSISFNQRKDGSYPVLA